VAAAVAVESALPVPVVEELPQPARSAAVIVDAKTVVRIFFFILFVLPLKDNLCCRV
jgi:hypothetical protein